MEWLNNRITSRYRSAYEFPEYVRINVAARSSGICEECGEQPATEFHHSTSVSKAIMLGWEISFIASEDNCSHVCHWCHQILDMTA